MPQVYVHLSMRDVEEALLKVYGIDSSQNEKKQTFIKCWRCGEFNLSSSKTCWRCGAPLSGKEALVKMLSEEEVNEWAELLLEFFKRIAQENPKIWETLKQIIKEKGKENLLIS
jgi:ribosomal protein L37E